VKSSNNLGAGCSGVIERLPSRKGWLTVIGVKPPAAKVKEVDVYRAKL